MGRVIICEARCIERWPHTCQRARTCAHAHTRTHVCVCVCARTSARTRARTHTHTHTHTGAAPRDLHHTDRTHAQQITQTCWCTHPRSTAHIPRLRRLRVLRLLSGISQVEFLRVSFFPPALGLKLREPRPREKGVIAHARLANWSKPVPCGALACQLVHNAVTNGTKAGRHKGHK